MRMPVRTILRGLALAAVVPLAACTTSGPGGAPMAPASAVEPVLADPCIKAASMKYYVLPYRASALSAERKGRVYEVTMKVDVRDALCTVTPKGKVISLVDTTPKSADQIAAEEKAKEKEGKAGKKAKAD